MCIFKFLFFTNVKLRKKRVFSFHHFFFQDYSFSGVGGSGADISFIDELVAVHFKLKLLHPFYLQSRRSRRRGQERWMVRSWCQIPEMDGSEHVKQTFSAVKWNLIMIRFGFNFLIFQLLYYWVWFNGGPILRMWVKQVLICSSVRKR